MKTVPNQRTITVNKEKTDKQHKYTVNNLTALDEAAGRLQTKGGFKLYMYLAKNQDKYNFALSSSTFCQWSGLGITAYNSAFQELVQEGYLVSANSENKKETRFIFYDKPRKPQEDQSVIIEVPKEKVIETRKIAELDSKRNTSKEFVF